MKIEMEPIQPGDKEITIYINEIRVLVDYDDVDQETARTVANFIVAAAKEKL
jgi:hypothetical protein